MAEQTTQIEEQKPLFSRQALLKLVIPLVIEQFLLMSVGMADTVMVTSAGEAAVSGVSLVDNINILLITVFAALSTGGAVVVSQYLGRQEPKHARTAAKQLLYAVVVVSAALMVFALVFRQHLLSILFGQIDRKIMDSALSYFIATALAYPFMSIYNAGAALFRAMGNSKVSMYNSLLVNIINISVNAVLIYGFHMGALGAGIGTLVSRIVAAVVILLLLQQQGNPLRIEKLFKPELHWKMVKRILTIGVPTGLENGIFQAGKLIILNLVTTLGATAALRTATTAANAISGSIVAVINVPGTAIGLALITVIGQCMGARYLNQAVSYTRKLMVATYISGGVLAVILFFAAGPLVALFGLGVEAAAMAVEVLRLCAVFSLLFWPLSFILPNSLRAAGDVKFTMCVSLISMFAFRIGISYLLASPWGLNLGLTGVWLGMCIDWIVRAAIFLTRFVRGKWKKIQVI